MSNPVEDLIATHPSPEEVLAWNQSHYPDEDENRLRMAPPDSWVHDLGLDDRLPPFMWLSMGSTWRTPPEDDTVYPSMTFWLYADLCAIGNLIVDDKGPRALDYVNEVIRRTEGFLRDEGIAATVRPFTVEMGNTLDLESQDKVRSRVIMAVTMENSTLAQVYAAAVAVSRRLTEDSSVPGDTAIQISRGKALFRDGVRGVFFAIPSQEYASSHHILDRRVSEKGRQAVKAMSSNAAEFASADAAERAAAARKAAVLGQTGARSGAQRAAATGSASPASVSSPTAAPKRALADLADDDLY